jgi:hypothetical protein
MPIHDDADYYQFTDYNQFADHGEHIVSDDHSSTGGVPYDIAN